MKGVNVTPDDIARVRSEFIAKHGKTPDRLLLGVKEALCFVDMMITIFGPATKIRWSGLVIVSNMEVVRTKDQSRFEPALVNVN